MKVIGCEDCEATFPIKISVMVAKIKAIKAGWTVGGLFYNHDWCPVHATQRSDAICNGSSPRVTDDPLEPLAQALARYDDLRGILNPLDMTPDHAADLISARQTVIHHVRHVLRGARR